MNLKTSNYGAARSILGISEILLWCGVGLGVIVALGAAGAASRGFGASGMVAAAPGIAISLFCFIGIVQVQMSKAAVDTADYTYQMLGIARDQLAVSKQALRQPVVRHSLADTSAKPSMSAAQRITAAQEREARDREQRQDGAGWASEAPAIEAPQRHWDYRGTRIHLNTHGAYLAEGRTFETLELAKLHVDGETLRGEMHRSGATQT